MISITYCNFFDDELEGKPVIDADLNIRWPRCWTVERAEQYRREHGLAYEQRIGDCDNEKR